MLAIEEQLTKQLAATAMKNESFSSFFFKRNCQLGLLVVEMGLMMGLNHGASTYRHNGFNSMNKLCTFSIVGTRLIRIHDRI